MLVAASIRVSSTERPVKVPSGVIVAVSTGTAARLRAIVATAAREAMENATVDNHRPRWPSLRRRAPWQPLPHREP